MAKTKAKPKDVEKKNTSPRKRFGTGNGVAISLFENNGEYGPFYGPSLAVRTVDESGERVTKYVRVNVSDLPHIAFNAAIAAVWCALNPLARESRERSEVPESSEDIPF